MKHERPRLNGGFFEINRIVRLLAAEVALGMETSHASELAPDGRKSDGKHWLTISGGDHSKAWKLVDDNTWRTDLY